MIARSYIVLLFFVAGQVWADYEFIVFTDVYYVDQKELETEIKNVRDGLKTKVSKLHHLEG